MKKTSITINGFRLRFTDESASALAAELERYIQETGTTYGFMERLVAASRMVRFDQAERASSCAIQSEGD